MLWNDEQKLFEARLYTGYFIYVIQSTANFYEDEKQIFKNNGIRDSCRFMYPLHPDTRCSLV